MRFKSSKMNLFMIIVILIFCSIHLAKAKSDIAVTERSEESKDLTIQATGVNYVKPFGNLGGLSLLANNPMFSNLGLTTQQQLGVMMTLLNSGLINPNQFRPIPPIPSPLRTAPPIQQPNPLPAEAAFNANLFNPVSNSIDPYFLLLLSHYSKYLPQGLGPQGIYGSSGLPKTKPPGVFNYSDKN